MAESATNGVRWQDQRLSVTPLEVIEQVRASLRTGHFNKAAWDHNHPNRTKNQSNKIIKITASILLGKPQRFLPMDEAWQVVLQAAVGGGNIN